MKVWGSLALFLLTITVSNVIAVASGANILLLLQDPMYSSRTKSISSVGGALTKAGHNVTLLTSSVARTRGFTKNTYTRAIHYKVIENEEVADMSNAFMSGIVSQIMSLNWYLGMLREGCSSLFDDTALLSILKESTFDVLIGDVFDGCDALVSRYLGLPLVAVTSSGRYPLLNERSLGIPLPSSYAPIGILSFSDRMTFFERVVSFLEHHFIMKWFEITHFSALNEVKDKYGIAPGESIPEILGKVELWMSMTSFALHYPHPTGPNWIAIGNAADRPPKPLPKDYIDFIDGSGKHGFILFSMGTHITEFPDPEMAETFARVLSELPQRVIWRYTGTRPRSLGNNTILTNWLPQNDLLGHPKARLLIYHGGQNGIMEAVYHAVPIVIMPIFAEQRLNSRMVVNKGMGKELAKDNISYDTVRAIVTEVLENPSYAEQARKISSIHRDGQFTSGEAAVVFWVEHILKFGGSHLRSRALELNLIQLHSIDVMMFLGGVVYVVLFTVFICTKRCLACCFLRKKTKVE